MSDFLQRQVIGFRMDENEGTKVVVVMVDATHPMSQRRDLGRTLKVAEALIKHCLR